MFADAIAERWQRVAGFVAEPQELAQVHRIGIEPDPDDAAARLLGQIDVYADLAGPGRPIAGLELHVAQDAVGFQHEVVAGAIDLGPKDLDVARPPTVTPVGPKNLNSVI